MYLKTTAVVFIVLIFSLLNIRSTRAQSGQLDPVAVDSLLAFCQHTGANGVLLYHRDEVAVHWQDTSCQQPMNTASMVKSWTGLVVGILIDRGAISGVDARVCDYIPEWQAGCDSNVTVRHLLSMSAGIAKKRASESVLAQDDMNAFVQNVSLDWSPGTKFSYSNESVQLLGLLMERATGKSADQLFRELLFDPLQMNDSELYKDKAGNAIVYGGTTTSIEDAAKVGRLMLNHGRYDEQQVVSPAWVEASLQPSSTYDYYGLTWWVDAKMDRYTAMGDFGQMTVIFPSKGLVFVRQQSCRNTDPSQNMNWMGPDFYDMIGRTVR